MMTIERQVEIIETQCACANLTLFEEVQYIAEFFKPDPDFSQEAIDIVLSNLSKRLKK